MEVVYNFDELCQGEEFTEEDVVNTREVCAVFLLAVRYLSNKYHN